MDTDRDTPILEVRGLSAAYGTSVVLRDFDLALNAGEMTCLLGSNGAGKTTVLGAIMGSVRVAAGSVRLQGTDVTHSPVHRSVAAGIALVPEGRELFPGMTVEDHLRLAHALCPNPLPIEEIYEVFPVLGERTRQIALTLSGGEQQMLAIARALLQRPKVLLLDEPSLGLAPLLVRSVIETARRVADQGTPVCLAEQNARLALQLADRALVLENGNTVLSGSAAELRDDDAVREAYLGGPAEVRDSNA